MSGGNGKANGKARTEDQNGREPNGRWKKGVVPEGAKPFPPGVSGNPNGRPAGATFAEWCNVMQDWPQSRLSEVTNDPEQPAMKRAAAHQTAQAADGAGGPLDRVCDRTSGKAKQALELSGRLDHDVRPTVNGILDDPQVRNAAKLLADRLPELGPGSN